MAIKVLLFGRLSEMNDVPSFEIECDKSLATPEAVRALLNTENAGLGRALNEPQILVALNKEIVSLDHPLKDGDELAFLPPVTGG